MKVTKLGNNCELREYANGDKFWWQNNQLHRVDGPAVEWADGDKRWYQNGKRHRVDGPAVEYSNGSKAWYIKDKKLTEAEFKVHPVHQGHLFDREVERVLAPSYKHQEDL